jgi:hypothetical protein
MLEVIRFSETSVNIYQTTLSLIRVYHGGKHVYYVTPSSLIERVPPFRSTLLFS